MKGGTQLYIAMLGNKVINILSDTYSTKREYLKTVETDELKFRCPNCKDQVMLRWAPTPKKRPHFRHKNIIDCPYEHDGESEQHYEGKLKLYHYFKDLLDHKAKIIDIEKYIPQTKQIADIYIQFHNGTQWVIEYQRSNIPSEDIKRRKDLYKQANIHDIWIAGENLVSGKRLALCSILNAGQSLIFQDTFSKSHSLITYNPSTNVVNILRGLESQNNRSYTYNFDYEFNLEEICFNLWGDPFCFEDYLQKPKINSINEGTRALPPFTMQKDYLYKAPSKQPYYYVDMYDKNSNEEFKLFFPIDHPLDKYIPVEMKDIQLTAEVFSDLAANEEQVYNVIEIIPKRWIDSLNNRKSNKVEVPFWDDSVRNGLLLSSLEHLYHSKFQTKDELNEMIKKAEKGEQLPLSTRNYHLRKHKLIKEDFHKLEFAKVVPIEKALSIFLGILKVKVNHISILSSSVEHKILLPVEIDQPFTNKLLSKIVKRVNTKIPFSPIYHHSYGEISSIWDMEFDD